MNLKMERSNFHYFYFRVLQINLALDSNLILFCWGDDNNSPDNIKLMKTLGVHGIIYDKMDQLSTKTDKVSMECLCLFEFSWFDFTTILSKNYIKFQNIAIGSPVNILVNILILLIFPFYLNFFSIYFLYPLLYYFIDHYVTTLFYEQKKQIA